MLLSQSLSNRCSTHCQLQRHRQLGISSSILQHSIIQRSITNVIDTKSGTSSQHQRSSRAVVAGAGATAAAVPAAQAAFPALQAIVEPWLPYAMAASAACCLVLMLMMALAPAAAVTQRSARSNAPLIALAVLYGIVLLASWSTDTVQLMMPGSLQEGLKGGFHPQFFPTLDTIQTLFARPFTAASFLLHVLAINLIAARSAFLDGLTARIPTFHSILLSAVVGPLGLLTHQLTKAIYAVVQATTGRDLRPAAQPVRIRADSSSGQGTITILPYDK